MRSGVLAQKVGMTRLFTDAGEHVPVTVLRLGNCQVVAHRTKDKNGYVALQLGSGQLTRIDQLVLRDRKNRKHADALRSDRTKGRDDAGLY